MEYAVAIVFYNPNKNSFQNITVYQKVFKHILIIDNSTTSNEDYFLNRDGVIYQFMGGNKGMAVALNEAYKWAIENSIDYLLTMDQDTYYPSDEIEKMVRFIEKQESQGIDNVCIYSANFAKQYTDSGNNVVGPLNIERERIQECSFSMTSGSYMKVSFLKRIMPIEDWFIGMVDYDVCASLKVNYPLSVILRYGNSVMYQVVGEQLENTWINKFFHIVHLSNDRYYYMERNSRFFLDKYRTNRRLCSIMRKQRMRILFNVIFEKDRIEKVKLIVDGRKAYKKNEYGVRIR
ncbi:glycosyltransferase [Enterococcus sp. DIV1314a]|uniref:glycosyltransferase n=1 Tax=Enterococcus sp. DIV1314a TaxID=2774660 RepID=UPI003F2862E5